MGDKVSPRDISITFALAHAFDTIGCSKFCGKRILLNLLGMADVAGQSVLSNR